LQWTLCRRDEHDRRLALRAFYQHRQQQAAAPQLQPSGPGGAADWRAEIERLTSYEGVQSKVVADGGSEGVVMR